MRCLLLIFSVFMAASSAYGQGISCANLNELLAHVSRQNWCRTDHDCASVDLPPRFGCHMPMSKEAALNAVNILESYKSGCGPLLYTCFDPPPLLICNNRTCVISQQGFGRRFPSVGAYDQNGRPLQY